MSRTLVWFSDGAASAVALKMAKGKYPDLQAFYCATNSEHPDNKRFRKEIESWTNTTITVLKSDKYENVDDVIQKTRFLRGPNGARCTTELKKNVRTKFQLPDDRHIFGYTYDEPKRIVRLLAENWDLRLECPLYSAKIRKEDCFNILKDAGIELPMMYRLGFNNNNCIGCVKAESPAYWNRIREHFPDVFWARAKQEREYGFALTRWRKKSIFLDELDPKLVGNKNEKLDCGFLCGK